MLTIRRARTALREFVFGPPIPQFCTVGLKYPQSEVRVWLRGLGTPLDVTDTNVIVAARPFTVGIGLERIPEAATIERAHLFMNFSDHSGDNRWLGEIRLSYAETIRIGDRALCLFRGSRSTNRCLPEAWFGGATWILPVSNVV